MQILSDTTIRAEAKRLRILFVTPRCYPDMGGIETHVYEVGRLLSNKGMLMTVLATDRSGKLDSATSVDGMDIVRVPAYPRNRDYYYAPALGKAIQQGTWDIIHIQGFHTLVPPLAMWAAQRAGIPYVVTFHSGGHSSALRNAARPIQAKMMWTLLAGAQRLIGVSYFEAEQFQRWLNLPAERFTVVPNGANLPPVPEDFEPPCNGDTILSVGRLERYKGHHRLIEAMPFVLAQRPSTRLRILGLGPYEAALRQQVLDMGLGQAVQITHVPPDDRTGMAREMLSAALVALFSEYEAHPVAVMEAAALKRSILVADTSGLGEMARNGLAAALPLDSTPEQLAAAMLRQLEHPHVPNAAMLPTWDTCAEQLLNVYMQVAGAES
jgi:glycosyltransferase involved in cell wall biosynthesis